MCDNQEVTVEELEDIGNVLAESVTDLESLEIYLEQHSGPIHLSFKTSKSANIRDFLKFTTYSEGDEFKDASKFNMVYKNINFSFNRVHEITQDYTVFVLVSKEEVGGEKKGMIVISDASGVLFISTCKSNVIGKMNLGLIKEIYQSG